MKRVLGLDRGALHRHMDAKRKMLGWSWRRVARELMVAPSTLTRLAASLGPDADALVRMLEWTGHPLGKFARRGGGEWSRMLARSMRGGGK